jgi:hypothetical protein
MRVSVLTLLAGIAAVVVGSSGVLLVVLTVILKGRWELLDLLALAVSLALLMSGLQLLSWFLCGSEDRH